MESISKFLDPNAIPEVTVDVVDIKNELDKGLEAETDSDTVEVNLSKEKELKKVSDVVLPGKKEKIDDSDDAGSDKEETKEVKKEESDVESTDDTEKESEEVEKEELSKDVSEEETNSDESEKEEQKESEDKSDTVEDAADTVSSEENSDVEKEDSKEETKEEPVKESTEEENKEDNVDSEQVNDPADETVGVPAGLVDQGLNDLAIDTQQAAPLLKLVKEYEFYDTKIYELPNGANVVYVNKPSDLCICSFDFKVGSYYEDDSNRGISHLLEHLMFNGCPGISALEFNAKLDKMGMQVNAFTDRMKTAFHFSGLKANFIPAFELFANLINSFTPTQEIVDKEKGVVINEIGVYNDNNWSVLHEAIHAQAYRQHPIAHPILGYEDVIDNITVDQVKEWYETNYNAKNLTLYLVGDFPEEDLVFIADKIQQFRDGNKNADPVITDAMAMPFYKNVIAYKEGVTQTLIDSSLPAKNEAFNYYELIIMANVLGGTMSSYLWNEFREERSIAYQVGAYSSNMDPAHLNIHVYAGLNDSDDAELAKGIFKDAFNYAKAISEDEFSKGLNIALSGELNQEETEDGILDIVRDAQYLGFDVDAFVTTLKNLTYQSYQTFVEELDTDAMVTGILYPTMN